MNKPENCMTDLDVLHKFCYSKDLTFRERDALRQIHKKLVLKAKEDDEANRADEQDYFNMQCGA